MRDSWGDCSALNAIKMSVEVRTVLWVKMRRLPFIFLLICSPISLPDLTKTFLGSYFHYCFDRELYRRDDGPQARLMVLPPPLFYRARRVLSSVITGM